MMRSFPILTLLIDSFLKIKMKSFGRFKCYTVDKTKNLFLFLRGVVVVE